MIGLQDRRRSLRRYEKIFRRNNACRLMGVGMWHPALRRGQPPRRATSFYGLPDDAIKTYTISLGTGSPMDQIWMRIAGIPTTPHDEVVVGAGLAEFADTLGVNGRCYGAPLAVASSVWCKSRRLNGRYRQRCPPDVDLRSAGRGYDRKQPFVPQAQAARTADSRACSRTCREGLDDRRQPAAGVAEIVSMMRWKPYLSAYSIRGEPDHYPVAFYGGVGLTENVV
jgi:hypothetical protein